MLRRASFWLLTVFLLGLVGCDHATKHWAESELRGHPNRPIVENVLELAYTQNRDVGFSLLGRAGLSARARKPVIFVMATIGLVVLSAMWVRRRGAGWPEHAAFALLTAGAIGNLSDRLIRGYVVDFVYLHHWPVFNAADVWLVAGGILLFLTQVRQLRPSADDPASPAVQPAPHGR